MSVSPAAATETVGSRERKRKRGRRRTKKQLQERPMAYKCPSLQ